MSAHAGIQFRAAPSEPHSNDRDSFLSLSGTDTNQKKLVEVHKPGTHGAQFRANIKHGVCAGVLCSELLCNMAALLIWDDILFYCSDNSQGPKQTQMFTTW